MEGGMPTIADAARALADGRTTSRALVKGCFGCIDDPETGWFRANVLLAVARHEAPTFWTVSTAQQEQTRKIVETRSRRTWKRPSLHFPFPNAGYAHISPHTEGDAETIPAASPDITEGIMMKESTISLIAATALFGIAMLSIAGAFSGRVAFDDQPDAMVTQLYTAGVAANAVLASNVPSPAYQLPR
jgi:hypothetical protein